MCDRNQVSSTDKICLWPSCLMTSGAIKDAVPHRLLKMQLVEVHSGQTVLLDSFRPPRMPSPTGSCQDFERSLHGKSMCFTSK